MYGYGSYNVDGRRVALQTRAAYAPQSFGPSLAAVPTSQPNVPPGLLTAPTTAGTAGVTAMGTSLAGDVGGYGTSENNALATAIAADNPWSFRDSPVLPALLFLLVGMLGLRLIHWRRG